jgi:hypothetical protein
MFRKEKLAAGLKRDKIIIARMEIEFIKLVIRCDWHYCSLEGSMDSQEARMASERVIVDLFLLFSLFLFLQKKEHRPSVQRSLT